MSATASEPEPQRITVLGGAGFLGSHICRSLVAKGHRVLVKLTRHERLPWTSILATAVVAGKQQLTIPYAAVFYDPSGHTWTYVATEPLVFVRKTITVVSIQGETAYLSAGPPAGTAVVTVGVSALYGSEVGVEEE